MTNATKQCTGCSQTFPATREFFHAHSSGKFGLQAACRECQAAEKRAYYRSAKGREAARAYTAKNRDKIRAYVRSRPMSEAKQEEGRQRAREWYRNNKERARAHQKKQAASPEFKVRNRVYQYRYHARRLRNDGEYALRSKMRVAILTALKQGRATAKGRWWEAAAGYTLEELRRHLEQQFAPGMTWENRGKVWEIDHIRPLAGFVIPDAECPAFREAWGLTNLRPLLKADNRAKGGPRP